MAGETIFAADGADIVSKPDGFIGEQGEKEGRT
jgi:hypothetical protein